MFYDKGGMLVWVSYSAAKNYFGVLSVKIVFDFMKAAKITNEAFDKLLRTGSYNGVLLREMIYEHECHEPFLRG
jgi:hypothetical protein